jgi:hypothetical protein
VRLVGGESTGLGTECAGGDETTKTRAVKTENGWQLDAFRFLLKLDTESTKAKRHKPLWIMAF